ncbi:MAG: UMP kinase [Parcubacteria group bacterium]|nr:UMP kinase [Parcubacteria group bacterium]
MSKPVYKRIMLKLSGEALLGKQDYGIDAEVVKNFCQQLVEINEMGVAVAVEIGGGNIYRWRDAQAGISREVADLMGIMGSVMNALNFSDIGGEKVKALSSLSVPTALNDYTIRKANKYLAAGKVVVIGGGTGDQFSTTDTGAALHALQLGCEVVLKGTNVDGIYDSDPKENPQAQKYDQLTYDEVLEKKLNAMDMTAFALCRDNNLPLILFSVLTEGNIKKVVLGEKIGTRVEK